jgi:hypothetical protein
VDHAPPLDAQFVPNGRFATILRALTIPRDPDLIVLGVERGRRVASAFSVRSTKNLDWKASSPDTELCWPACEGASPGQPSHARAEDVSTADRQSGRDWLFFRTTFAMNAARNPSPSTSSPRQWR